MFRKTHQQIFSAEPKKRRRGEKFLSEKEFCFLFQFFGGKLFVYLESSQERIIREMFPRRIDSNKAQSLEFVTNEQQESHWKSFYCERKSESWSETKRIPKICKSSYECERISLNCCCFNRRSGLNNFQIHRIPCCQSECARLALSERWGLSHFLFEILWESPKGTRYPPGQCCEEEIPSKLGRSQQPWSLFRRMRVPVWMVDRRQMGTSPSGPLRRSS